MVTGSKGNNNMMLVMEWVVDFMVDAKTKDVKTAKKNSTKKNSGKNKAPPWGRSSTSAGLGSPRARVHLMRN